MNENFYKFNRKSVKPDSGPDTRPSPEELDMKDDQFLTSKNLESPVTSKCG